MTGFGSFDNSTCERVLDLLEPGDLRLGQAVIKRVAVVKLGVNNGESDCLFGQLDRISWTSDSEAGVKTEKSGGVAGGVGECGDDVVGLLVPASHHSVFYRPDALPAAQPTASKH